MATAAYSREDLEREQLARRLNFLREAAQAGDIRAHSELLVRNDAGMPLRLAQHQLVWAEIARQVEQYRWVVIVAPPGYAKSTFWSVNYVSQQIGLNPRVRVGLVSNTHTQAKEFSKAVQQVVEHDWYREVYPGVAPNYDMGYSDDQWYVTGASGPPNPTLLASGIGGPVLGKRFDVIILDDPTTWEQARSKTVMQNQRQWLKTTLLRRFPAGQGPPHGSGGRMIVPLTRWGITDLVPTFRDLGFKIIRMPALGFWDRRCPHCDRIGGYHEADCPDPYVEDYVWGTAPLWPLVETAEQLLQLQEDDPLVFNLVMQGDEKAGAGGDVFDPDTFQRGLCPWDQIQDITMYIDTASGKERMKGDFFVAAILGRERGNLQRGWVMHVERGRWPAPVQQSKVVALAESWHVQQVWIEDKNEGVALYQNLVASTRLPVQLDEIGTTDKEWRAIPIAQAYRNRFIWHHQASWNNSYERELETFPIGDHDDQVDAAGGAWRKMGHQGPRIRVLTSRPR